MYAFVHLRIVSQVFRETDSVHCTLAITKDMTSTGNYLVKQNHTCLTVRKEVSRARETALLSRRVSESSLCGLLQLPSTKWLGSCGP